MEGTEFLQKSKRPNEVILDGVITLDGSSDVTSHTIKGVNATTTHPATGKYVLSLKEPYYGGCKGIHCTIEDAAAVAVWPQLYGTTDADVAAATPTLELAFTNGSAFTDPPASKKIVVVIRLQRGSVMTGA